MTIALFWFARTPDDSSSTPSRNRLTLVTPESVSSTAGTVPSAPTPEESQRITRIRAGDVDAFDTLCAEYWTPLWRYAHRILHAMDAADDVTQDVLFDCWRRRAQLDPARGVRAYLYTAVRHRALELLRHDRVVARAELMHDPIELAGTGDSLRASSDATTEQELLTALDRVLTTLPAARRDVLILRWRHGLRYEEIAAILGIGLSAVKMQVRRAFVLLRPLLEREFRDM